MRLSALQVDMKDTDLYKENWIGLRTLDESGRLVLGSVPGAHMHFTLQWFLDNVVDPTCAVPPGPATVLLPGHEPNRSACRNMTPRCRPSCVMKIIVLVYKTSCKRPHYRACYELSVSLSWAAAQCQPGALCNRQQVTKRVRRDVCVGAACT